MARITAEDRQSHGILEILHPPEQLLRTSRMIRNRTIRKAIPAGIAPPP
ncbi:hypothetical protein [Thermoleptolyngbya sp. M55_K2018_002]|nr:hypothetical protein [Thermoleptolyngbya sp. M55_K2018_002]HIK39745.1 hypothetical protein [Thermoleptolyngbya sp. M55_K2018_002]